MNPSDSRKWYAAELLPALMTALGVVLALWILYQARTLVLILFTAIIINLAFRPLSNRLQQWGFLPIPATVLPYVLLTAGLAALLSFFLPIMVEQGVAVFRILPEYYHQIIFEMAKSPNLILREIALRLPLDPAAVANLTPETQPAATVDFSGFFAGLSLGFKTLFIVIATLLLSFFWTIEGERAIMGLLLLLPLETREQARSLITEIQEKVGAYLRGQAVLCLIIGIAALLAYGLIGVPYALLLAVFAGIMEAVPYVGPFLGAVPATLIAFSVSPTMGLWVIGSTLVIQQLENAYLVPRVMSRTVGISPLVVMLAIFAFESLFGLIGVLLAIPIAVILQILMDRILLQPSALDKLDTPERDNLSVLRYQLKDLLSDIQKQARTVEAAEAENPIDEQLEAVAKTLDGFLEQQSAVGQEQIP